MQKRSAYFLVLAVAAMLVLGIVMLFSTSAFARDSHGDPFYFVKRQAIWLGVGFVVMVAAAVIDYHFWQRIWWLLFGVSAVLLVLCFIPPIGMRINGSSRWVNLGVLSFQPSDIAKLASITFLAFWFSKYEKQTNTFLTGFIKPIAIVGVLMGLIVCEVDLGTTALIGATMFTVLFVAGTHIVYIGGVALLGLGAIAFAITKVPERMGRVLAFLYPERYEADFYQQLQGLIALGSGGVDGLGLGNGRQKMSYLPFAHTDFILPMIGEELGLRVTLLVVFCYLVIVLCGTLISINAKDRFGMLLGLGIVMMTGFQAAVNIGVTTALLPNKGLPLPFISYGGSNLVFCMLGMGILLNICRQGVVREPDPVTTRLRVRVTPRI